MALAFPFLIKAYKIKADPGTINRLVRLLESVTFRYLLRGGRAEIEARLNHYLIHFESTEDIHNNIDAIVKNIQEHDLWGYWNNYSMNYYLKGHFYKNRVDNYLLWKYELYLSNENHPAPHKVTFSELIKNESIEHIAPQTQAEGIPIANGYGVYHDVELPENGIVSGHLLNEVGNFMLISRQHNSSIGNKAFADKLKSYGTDNLLNQQKQVSHYVSDPSNPLWDRQSILQRREHIVNAANEIWKLENI